MAAAVVDGEGGGDVTEEGGCEGRFQRRFRWQERERREKREKRKGEVVFTVVCGCLGEVCGLRMKLLVDRDCIE